MKHIKLFEQLDKDFNEGLNWNTMYNTPNWKALKSSIKNLLEEGFDRSDIDTYLSAIFNWGGLNDDNL